MIVSMSLGAIIKPKWLVLIAGFPDWIDNTLKLIFYQLCGTSGVGFIVQQNGKKKRRRSRTKQFHVEPPIH